MRTVTPTSTPRTELIISGRAWHRLRPLLVDRGMLAVGAIQGRDVPENGRELLVDDLAVSAEMPTGNTRPPLDEYCVVVIDHDGVLEPEVLLRQLAPRQSHLLALVLIDMQRKDTCRALLFERNTLRPVDGLRVTGPGMLYLSPHRTVRAAENDDSEIRWSRLAGAIGKHRLARLRDSTVTIVGAGRTGSQLALQLAAIGVSSLRLIDGDTLALENLDAMPGLTVHDVGRSKVEALALRLCEFRPDLAVSYVTQPISDPAAQALLARRADLLVTCVDNDTARLAASIAARRSLTVHLDVGTSVQRPRGGPPEIQADVRLLLAGEGCVASCIGGVDDPERRLYDVASPPGALQRGRPQPWNRQRAGSLITINSVAVGTAVQAWLDLCTSRITASMWYRLAWQPASGLQCHAGPVAAAVDCRFCNNLGTSRQHEM